MEASSSAPEPHQVSGLSCHFAGPTSGTVARAHSSLDSLRFDLTGVCRLRNDVADVLRKLLKIIPELHEQGRLRAAAVQMKCPRPCQVVRSANQPKDRCHNALPDHHRRSVHVDVCVCAGGCACSKIFVDTTSFAFGRSPLTCRSAQRTGAARARRSGVAALACSWLMVPRTHDLGLNFR